MKGNRDEVVEQAESSVQRINSKENLLELTIIVENIAAFTMIDREKAVK